MTEQTARDIHHEDKDTLTRAKLADTLQERLGDSLKLTRQRYMEVVDGFFEELCTALTRGESVKISSFGSFLVRHKKARLGRNPKTGEDAPISERRVIAFRPSQTLKSRVNGGKKRF